MHEDHFVTPKGRYDHMSELVDRIDAVLADKSRDEWGEIFDREGLIWGPVLTLDEVASDRQAEAIDMFPEIEHQRLGTYRSVRIPFRMRDADVRPRGPAPDVGQHTLQILADDGFSEAEIAQLQAQGAIGGSGEHEDTR
jgi:crotonobetainyl-CoA:carnitine CoA-transferase CaiB-like acyl-CoA transferase